MDKSINIKISRNTLQIIAIITMVIDHINTVFNPLFVEFFTKSGMTSENLIRHSNFDGFLYGIGRIAFPIFAFLIADGCLHTRNIKKYAFRLGIFAVISEIFYDYANNFMAWYMPMRNFKDFINRFGFSSHNNVIFSLFASVLFIIAIQKFQEKIKNKFSVFQVVKLLAIFFVLYFCSMILGAEYWQIAIPMITLMYICKKKSSKIAVLSIFLTLFYIIIPIFDSLRWGETIQQAISGSIFCNFNITNAFLVLFLIISIILISLYSYNPEHKPRNNRLIYLFYPVHLFILGLIRDIYIAFIK